MKKLTLLAFLFSVMCLLISCKEDNPEPNPSLKSNNGFPEKPENLSFVNSEFDDYNSNLPEGEYKLHTLTFSSNRVSKGGQFDLVQKKLDISYLSKTKVLQISEATASSSECLTIIRMLKMVNTDENEYGPYFYVIGHETPVVGDEKYLFYTQSQAEKLRIRFMTERIDYVSGYTSSSNIYGPYDVSVLNSDAYSVGYLSVENNRLYYQSDCDGDFDLYELDIDSTMEFKNFLTQDFNLQARARKILSSQSDDKCPFVSDNIMVFTSDRAGGYGGFDLWYSKYEDGQWGEAINFGPEVNTEFDEYRPIVLMFNEIPNDLMIFSSNRAGGLGGFDLYCVGININLK